jgi:ribose-phosphate pyrophosphokinase
MERLRDAPITELVVTDSIPVPPEKRDPRLSVLSVANLFGEAIRRIHDGRSVSELF